MPPPAAFAQLLREGIGESLARETLEKLSAPPVPSIRLNPSKLSICPFPGAKPIPWSPHGFVLTGERPAFARDPRFHAGAYYVQEASAQFVGHCFRALCRDLPEGCAVLDLCAAPGGKSTDMAASLRERFGEGFTLVSNETIHARNGILRDVLEAWGDPRAATTCLDPEAMGKRAEGVFDLILADVPCSGEGMFRKSPEALQAWSLDTVQRCAARARRILGGIWPALKPGGTLLFSTCTLNAVENDGTVDWALSSLPGAEPCPVDIPPPSCGISTRHGILLLPGFGPGEGQFVSAIQKQGDFALSTGRQSRRLAEMLSRLGAKPVEPLETEGLPRWELDREAALCYLRGEALSLPADAPRGKIVLCHQDLALGWGKNIGARCNNLYPKHRRLR